ncbi:PA2169 family four-helix-bundle protein [Herbaspirillum sp. SJZ099]|uniref:PA2169 family four-helix-bundle protein n=1 Tax=Herbaspirillum sp. SJZ099 TaxID=2572916 RepID=UPI0011AB0006|nr:PA2169 family four-helix-bundle protein [Herbaspirillum sp. SJZ099]TWC62416.1 uncharacterized protein (TIGR02284 family) [Herbaspirillum sp. SJZ099]
MTNDHLISALNDLIQISKDGEKGFRTCAEDAEQRDARYQEMFMARAAEYGQVVLELQDLVHRLGREPANHSTFGGTLHRQWVALKAALMGRDDETVLSECERCEDAAIHAYRQALSLDLPNDVRLIVERQYQGVLANHDKVRGLHNQVRRRNAA